MAGSTNASGMAQAAIPAVICSLIYRACVAIDAHALMIGLFGAAAVFCWLLVLVRLLNLLKLLPLIWSLRKAVGTYGSTDRFNALSPEEMGLSTSNEDGNGIPLGAKHGARKSEIIYYDGDGHGINISSTGGGKTSSGSVLFCLGLGAHRNLITTAKGADLAFASYYKRTSLGQNVICINPNKLLCEHGLPAHNFNPVGHFPKLAENSDPNLILKAQEVALVLLPESKKGGGDNAIFRQMARSIIQWCLIYLAFK